jgi:nitroreductase
VLQQVLDAVRYTPTGHNVRDWKFSLITNQEVLRQLSEGAIAEIDADPLFGPLFHDYFEVHKRFGNDPIFFGAPALLVVHNTSEMPFDTVNGSIALTYAMMAAQSLGLGTCWMGLAQIAFRNKTLLKLSGGRGKCCGVLMLGYPAVFYQRTPPRAPIKVKIIN